MRYCGKEIITSLHMTKTSDPFSVKRTWRERLFSWPWRPWQTTKMITKQIPSDEVYVFEDRMMMHPETLRQLQAELKEHTNEDQKRRFPGLY